MTGKRNHEHYYDPTASEAIEAAEYQQRRREAFEKFLNTIWTIAELGNFRIQNRLIVEDLKTGEIYK